MLCVEVGRVDRLLQVHPAVDVTQEHVQRPLLLLVASGRAVREPRLAAAQNEPRERVVRGRVRGCSDDARPSSSQNICARVPRGQPSAGMTGELCSQPPDGVAENMFPKRSATSR